MTIQNSLQKAVELVTTIERLQSERSALINKQNRELAVLDQQMNIEQVKLGSLLSIMQETFNK